MILPGRVKLELHRHSPRRSSGVLRTACSGLGRKVAPDFSQSLHSFTKICHAFRARTALMFCSLRGYGGLRFTCRACTRVVPPYTLRGAAVWHSLLSFVRAFDHRAPPATPHARWHALTRTKFSPLIAKRVPRISFAIDGRQAFARVIPAFPSVMQVGFAQVENWFTCIPLVKPGRPMQQPTIL